MRLFSKQTGKMFGSPKNGMFVIVSAILHLVVSDFIGPCWDDMIENIPNSSLIGSDSPTSAKFAASYARLNSTTAWCQFYTGNPLWLQIDLGEIVILNGITTAGRPGINQWISQYTLTFSNDSNIWTAYGESLQNPGVLAGNADHSTKVSHSFLDAPIVTRYVRVYPISYQGLPCLKLALPVCTFTFYELYYDWPPVIEPFPSDSLS